MTFSLLEHPHTRLSHSVTKSRSGIFRSTCTGPSTVYTATSLPSMLVHLAVVPFWANFP